VLRAGVDLMLRFFLASFSPKKKKDREKKPLEMGSLCVGKLFQFK
jgi:hypothetical protein